MHPLLRRTLVRLYGAANIRLMEAAPRPDGRDGLTITPDRVAIAASPPAASPILAEPETDDQSPDTLTIERDETEAARFSAEIERDAALGDDANWPHP